MRGKEVREEQNRTEIHVGKNRKYTLEQLGEKDKRV